MKKYFISALLVLSILLALKVNEEYAIYSFYRTLFTEKEVRFATTIGSYYDNYLKLPDDLNEFSDYFLTTQDTLLTPMITSYGIGFKLGYRQSKKYVCVYSFGPDKKNDSLKNEINLLELNFVQYFFSRGDILLGCAPIEDICEERNKQYHFYYRGKKILNDKELVKKVLLCSKAVVIKYFNITENTLLNGKQEVYLKAIYTNNGIKINTLCNPFNAEHSLLYIINYLQKKLNNPIISEKVDSFYFPVAIFDSVILAKDSFTKPAKPKKN